MPTAPMTFRPPTAPSRAEARAAHDARRGSARERGYTSRWDKAAKTWRQRHPLCLGCLAVGRTEPATLVDHIVPHRSDVGLFWDSTNWQASCAWHHDAVKARLETMWDAGTIGTDALRLDSEAAVEMTKDLDPRA